LNEKPWRHRWDRRDLKGVIIPPMKRYEHEDLKRSHHDHALHKRWDMMDHYRKNINDEDLREINKDIRTAIKNRENNKEVIIMSKKLVSKRRIPNENIIDRDEMEKKHKQQLQQKIKSSSFGSK
jgi:hypothetical protein